MPADLAPKIPAVSVSSSLATPSTHKRIMKGLVKQIFPDQKRPHSESCELYASPGVVSVGQSAAMWIALFSHPLSLVFVAITDHLSVVQADIEPPARGGHSIVNRATRKRARLLAAAVGFR